MDMPDVDESDDDASPIKMRRGVGHKRGVPDDDDQPDDDEVGEEEEDSKSQDDELVSVHGSEHEMGGEDESAPVVSASAVPMGGAIASALSSSMSDAGSQMDLDEGDGGAGAPPPFDLGCLKEFELRVCAQGEQNMASDAARDFMSDSTSVEWTPEKLGEIFAALKYRWIPTHVPESGWLDYWDKAFGVDPKNHSSAISMVDSFHKQHKLTIGTLHTMMACSGMIREGTPEGKQVQDEFNKIIKIATLKADELLNRVEMHTVVSDDRMSRVEEGEVDLDNFTFENKEELDQERLRAVYQFVLKVMRERKVRRHGEDIYTQVPIKGPQPVIVQWVVEDGYGDYVWSKPENFRTLSLASRKLMSDEYRSSKLLGTGVALEDAPSEDDPEWETKRRDLLSELTAIARSPVQVSDKWKVSFACNSHEAPVFDRASLGTLTLSWKQ